MPIPEVPKEPLGVALRALGCFSRWDQAREGLDDLGGLFQPRWFGSVVLGFTPRCRCLSRAQQSGHSWRGQGHFLRGWDSPRVAFGPSASRERRGETSRIGHPSFHCLHYLLLCFLFSWQLIYQSK